jgi:CRP-like cAMP-binding protein
LVRPGDIEVTLKASLAKPLKAPWLRDGGIPPIPTGGTLAATHPDNHPIIRKLETIFKLSESEREALLRLPMQIADLRADQDIVREGDRPTRCFALLEGWTCSYKMNADGDRQIMGFSISGDMPDLQSLHLSELDFNVGTLTPCKIGFVEHGALLDLCKNQPRICNAFWRETLIEAAIFREWLFNVGRRSAFARIAHVFCELAVRMRAVGLATDLTYDFPVTQAELADATGLTTVHVNRTLRDLRQAGLAALKGGVLTIPDWEKLKQAGEFEIRYLHLKERADAA